MRPAPPPYPAVACYVLAALSAGGALCAAAVLAVSGTLGFLLGLYVLGGGVVSGAVLWTLGRICADLSTLRERDGRRDA
jgi:hypothetical protein